MRDLQAPMPQNWSMEVHAGTCTCTWLSPGGPSSGGRALAAKVRGPRFNPGWLPVFHSSLKKYSQALPMYMYMYIGA